MLGHKKSLYKFRRIEIISSIFSNHNGMKVEINHKEKKQKNHKNTDDKNTASSTIYNSTRKKENK